MALRGTMTIPVCSGRIQQEGEKVPRLCDAVRRSQTFGCQVPRFPQRAENLLDQKRTTRLRAKSLISLQSIVYKATSSILQVSRADGRSHRRSEVDRRRRPDYQVRRRGPVVCAVNRLLDCYWHCNLDCIRAVSSCRSNSVIVLMDRRRVRFSHLVRVHVLVDCDEDRHSPWMYVALRRYHFRRRIQSLSRVLEPILRTEHRLAIMLRNAKMTDSDDDDSASRSCFSEL